jgi:hypothetical protein
MSFVAKPTMGVQFTFRDNDNKESTSQVLLPAATTLANALTYATALRPLIAAVSDAVCVGMNLIVGYYENAPGTIPSSDIENKGVITLASANGQPSSFTIPSVLESVLQGNNADIDQANTDMSDLLDALTLGLSGTQPANAGGADLVGIKAAYKQNRRSHLSGRQRKG